MLGNDAIMQGKGKQKKSPPIKAGSPASNN